MKYFFLLLIVFSFQANAQCDTGRFANQTFSVIKTTVRYSIVSYNLSMDIYKPVGDTNATKPLLVFAHPGSFVGGSKTADPSTDSICTRMARRGFVTASIDYRVGSSSLMKTDSIYAASVVWKAIGDGKAAIRWFINDAETVNTCKVDTNNIFVGGNSAGAVLFANLAYITDTSKCDPYLRAVIDANGGFEGNSGNPGYTYKIKGIVSLSGAIQSLSFIDSSSVPSFWAHGDADLLVLFYSGCFLPSTGLVHFYCNGPGSLKPALDYYGVYNETMFLHGDGHTPWTGNLTKLNAVDAGALIFLRGRICPIK